MHDKYAKAGLIVLSVSLDDPADGEVRGRIVKFLEARKTAFRTFLLDDSPELWQEKLNIGGPPCIYLFDRDNRFVKKMYDTDVDFKVLDETIQELLKP